MSKTNLTHSGLIRQIIEKDDQIAFREFFDLNFNRVHETIWYFVRREDIVKELVSDTFFRFWENRKKIDPTANVEAYLYVIAKNNAYKYLRKHKGYLPNEGIPEAIPLLETPESSYIQKETTMVIRGAIAKLPDKCRLVFHMVRECGYSHKCVSETLKISPKTIENHISKANKLLANYIGGYAKDIWVTVG